MIPTTPDLRGGSIRTPSVSPKGVLQLLILAGAVLTVGLNWPGHLSYDSVVQLADGRSGTYHTWHPPFMAWLLGLGDRIVRGAGPFIALQAALLFGALGLLVRARAETGWAAVVALVLMLFLPQVTLWQAIVWKDVLFADFTVAGFTLLWLAHAGDGRGIGLPLLMAGAFAAFTGATLVRQNGMIMLLAGAGAHLYLAARADPHAPLRTLLRPAAIATALVVLSLTAAIVINRPLHQRSVDGDGSEAQIHMLETYDVVGAVAHDPALELGELPKPLASLIRRAAGAQYTPRGNDDLLNNAFDRTTSRDEAADALEAQWQDLLLHHPALWLRHRAEVFGWLVVSPHAVCPTETTGVDGPLDRLKYLGMTIHQSPRDLALEDYAEAFHGTPLYSHLAYAALALVLVVVMFRSKRRADAVFGFMLLGALAFVASFFLIGVACDYRYLYALDLCTLVVGFHRILDLRVALSMLLQRHRARPV